MDESVCSEAAPSLLAWGGLIAVVDRHTESELRSKFQAIDTQGRLGQLDFVNGAFRFRITRHNCLGAPWPRLVQDDDVSQRVLDTAKGVVVESNLCVLLVIGNHKLNGIAVPRAVGGIFMILVRHHDGKIDVL